jgi:hypothetical protein
VVRIEQFLGHWPHPYRSAVLRWNFQVAGLSQKSTLMVQRVLLFPFRQASLLLISSSPFHLSLLLWSLLPSALLQSLLHSIFLAFYVDDSYPISAVPRLAPTLLMIADPWKLLVLLFVLILPSSAYQSCCRVLAFPYLLPK